MTSSEWLLLTLLGVLILATVMFLVGFTVAATIKDANVEYSDDEYYDDDEQCCDNDQCYSNNSDIDSRFPPYEDGYRVAETHLRYSDGTEEIRYSKIPLTREDAKIISDVIHNIGTNKPAPTPAPAPAPAPTPTPKRTTDAPPTSTPTTAPSTTVEAPATTIPAPAPVKVAPDVLKGN